MTTKTYSQSGSAGRAARQACAAAGIKSPLSGVHFKVTEAEGGFSYELINVSTGETTDPDGIPTVPVVVIEPEAPVAEQAPRAPRGLKRSREIQAAIAKAAKPQPAPEPDPADPPTASEVLAKEIEQTVEAVAKLPSLIELAATIAKGSEEERQRIAEAYANANATRKADLERAMKERGERKARASRPRTEQAPLAPVEVVEGFEVRETAQHHRQSAERPVAKYQARWQKVGGCWSTGAWETALEPALAKAKERKAAKPEYLVWISKGYFPA